MSVIVKTSMNAIKSFKRCNFKRYLDSKSKSVHKEAFIKHVLHCARQDDDGPFVIRCSLLPKTLVYEKRKNLFSLGQFIVQTK